MSENQIPQTRFVAPSLEELAPLFPSYELLDFIAQGGMGAVYQARQISLDRVVAIKILPREFGDDPQFREAFEAEAKAMARLNHPNLIAVYDFGDIEGMLFIVMEFVEGKALFYSAHNKIIDPVVALGLVSKIARGLGHAHRGGIIHRDIKPANILLDPNARPKIGDFGLARPLDRENPGGIILGTPGYTAPEVYSREFPVDQRSDIFSLGAVLYELLCGRPPEAHTTALKSGVDPRIDTFLAKATQANPNFRYADIEDFANDLDALAPKLTGPRFATAASTQARPAVPVTPLASGKQKSIAIPIAVTLCLLGIGGAVAFVALKHRGNPSITTTPTPAPPPETSKKEREKQRKPEKARPTKDTMAGKPKPKREELKVEEQPAETPLQALARLRNALLRGERNEFPPTAIKEGDSTFFLVPTAMTWHAAREFAEEHGAQLANLKTTERLQWAEKWYQDQLPIWLGASDSGFEKKWFWDEGDPVAANLWGQGEPNELTNQSADGEDFGALSDKGPFMEDHSILTKHPFLIEWKADGTRPGSLESQLIRTGDALAKKSAPVFPTGTLNVGGARFLPVKRSLNQEEASNLAQKAGGHLAVFSNANEAATVSKLLLDTLNSNSSCWMGARRDELTPEIWNNVTGELFEFYQWLPGQPNDETFLVLRREGDSIGADDENASGHATSHALIEWSVPSLQNLPGKTSTPGNLGDSSAILDAIRNGVLDRHERDYRKYRRKYDKTVEDFLEDSITAVNDANRLPAPLRAQFVESLKEFKESNKLPPSLPRGVPREAHENLAKAQAEVDQLWEDYQSDFNEAKADYLRNLASGAQTAIQQRQIETAKVLTAESKLIEQDEDRFHKIMNGEKVPPPVIDN